jgi:hypothetical protein
MYVVPMFTPGGFEIGIGVAQIVGEAAQPYAAAKRMAMVRGVSPGAAVATYQCAR